jgi:uncharacterized membrane protein
MKYSPLSLEKIKSLRDQVPNSEQEHWHKLAVMEKIALSTTKKIGTMGFFIIIFLWTILWIAWNTLGPKELRFDPFPAFELWLFISNTIQLLLLPLLLVGQNLQNKYNEIRMKQDIEINKKSEREIETVLQHLENQNELIQKLIDDLSKK